MTLVGVLCGTWATGIGLTSLGTIAVYQYRQAKGSHPDPDDYATIGTFGALLWPLGLAVLFMDYVVLWPARWLGRKRNVELQRMLAEQKATLEARARAERAKVLETPVEALAEELVGRGPAPRAPLALPPPDPDLETRPMRPKYRELPPPDPGLTEHEYVSMGQLACANPRMNTVLAEPRAVRCCVDCGMAGDPDACRCVGYGYGVVS